MLAGLLHDYHDDCCGLLHGYHDDCWTIIIKVIILVTLVVNSSIITVVITISFFSILCISIVALDTIGDAEAA